MERYPEVMALLRAGRALLNLRQDQLADLAKVTRQTIARIEHANGAVPVETLDKVKDALERAGVKFLPSSDDCGPAIGLRKKARPTTSP